MPRPAGSSDALRAAIAQRQAGLTQRATAMLEASSHLHHYATDDMPTAGDEDPQGSVP